MMILCFCFGFVSSFVLPICFGFNSHSVELIKIFLEAQSNDIFASVTFSLGQLAGVING